MNCNILVSALVCALAIPSLGFADETAAESHLGRREVSVPIDNADEQMRLDYIRDILDREERRAWYWTFGWQAGFGAIMVGQGIWAGVAAANNDGDVVKERGIGAGAAGIGFISQFLSWLPSRHGTQHIDALDGPVSSKLLLAEATLYEGYKRQRFVRGILSHLGSLVVAGSSALILWQVWDLDKKAAINFPIALAVGQARVWTSPVLSLRGWQAYDSAYGKQRDVSLRLLPQPGGAALALTF